MAGESAREVARRSREKAERLNRYADAFEKGAAGEEATARALTALPVARWTVLHDVGWPGRRFANIDHVVIGPGGVFVIDSKAWSGSVAVRDGVLRQNGQQREKAVASAADAALAVSDAVWGLDPGLTRPVLCFVGDQHLEGWAREVMLCTPANLVAMLTSRPEVLDAPSARRTVANVQTALHAARSGTPAPGPSRHHPPVPPRSAVRPSAPMPPRRMPVPHRRRRSPLLTLLGVGAFLMLVLTGLFGVGIAALSSITSGALTSHGSGVATSSTSTNASRSRTVGASALLSPATNRPPLRVRVVRVGTVHRVGRMPYRYEGMRFVGVELVIHNAGKRGWTSQPGTTVEVTNAQGLRVSAGTAIRIREGRVLGDPIRLKPGGTARGHVVAQTSASEPITGVTLTVGPGQPSSASWTVDRQ